MLAASAQQAPLQAPATIPPPASDSEDDATVVVTGKRVRGSALSDIDPAAVLGPDVIRALGATSMKQLIERLSPLGRSFTGEEAALLLNGRRISGYADLQGIPPEAIERTEILSEQDAVRFGFAPTVRVMNFITVKNFRALMAQQMTGVTSEGGGETSFIEANSSQIDGSRRRTLNVSYFRHNRVLESDRGIAADPDLLGPLASVDPGRYRTIQPQVDLFHVDTTFAAPVSETLDGSLNVSMDAQRSRGLNGLSPGLMDEAPGGTGLLPSHPSIGPSVLRQRDTSLTLHAGGTLQGRIGRWSWTATSSFDAVRSTIAAEQGRPLAPPDAGGAASTTVDRSRTVTNTLVGNLVANGPAIRLPAGPVQMTVTTDYARSTSSGRLLGMTTSDLDFTRVARGASVAATVPITSPDLDLPSFLSRFTATGMIGVSDVSHFGQLTSSNYALNWAPAPALQLSASISRNQSPPAIALLTAPTVTAPNTPFFDFATGGSVLVNAISGGNPALVPERRRITTVGAAVQPIKNKDVQFSLDYVETDVRNLAVIPGGAILPVQLAFADRFLRAPDGSFSTVDLRSINITRQRERKLRLTTNLTVPLGKAPPPPEADAADASAPPPPPPKPRPTFTASISTTFRLDDFVTLRPDTPAFDLLDGATLDGKGGRPRWEMDVTLGLNAGPATVGTYARLQGPSRISSDLPDADLRFSGRTWIVFYSTVQVDKIVQRDWAKRMSMLFAVENLLNDRINVRDRAGATPNRYQGAYLDPVGRSIRLGVRKLF